MSTTERCATCRFFCGITIYPKNETAKLLRDKERKPGLCRYYPPTPGAIQSQLDRSSAQVASPIWISVSEQDWCGKYEANANSTPDPVAPVTLTPPLKPPKLIDSVTAAPDWTGVAKLDWSSSTDVYAAASVVSAKHVAPKERLFRRQPVPPKERLFRRQPVPIVPEPVYVSIEQRWLRPISSLSLSLELRMRLHACQIAIWKDLWITNDVKLLAATTPDGKKVFTVKHLEELYCAFLREPGGRQYWPAWLSQRFPPKPAPSPPPGPTPAAKPPAPKSPVKATPQKKAAPKAVSKLAQEWTTSPPRQRRCQHCDEQFTEYHVPIADEKSIWDRACVQCARELLFEETPKLEQFDYKDRQYVSPGRDRKEDTDPWQDNSIRAMEDK